MPEIQYPKTKSPSKFAVRINSAIGGSDFTDLAFSRAVSSYKKSRSKVNLQTYVAPSFNQATFYP